MGDGNNLPNEQDYAPFALGRPLILMGDGNGVFMDVYAGHISLGRPLILMGDGNYLYLRNENVTNRYVGTAVNPHGGWKRKTQAPFSV